MAEKEKIFLFASKSNPNAMPHELTQWDSPPPFYRHGSLTCNCAGWAKRVASDDTRTCPHVRLFLDGLADRYALSVRTLSKAQVSYEEGTISWHGRKMEETPDAQAVSNQKKLLRIKKQLDKKRMTPVRQRAINWR